MIGAAVQPRVGTQQHLLSSSVPHAGAGGVIDPNYPRDHGQAQPPSRAFTPQIQMQNQNHLVIPPQSGNPQSLNQPSHRFRPPNTPVSNGLPVGNVNNSTPRRFVPPTPMASQRFVPSSSGVPVQQVYSQNAATVPMTVPEYNSSAGHHPKRFVPSRTVVQNTASLQEQQPQGQRMAFTPRKNRFS